ncbi:DUF2165 family protein [Aestuariivita boseongensis]|uniref:DUF2165 family protein n=1 Tax=Aestuariivita boseongensis TaxID=1470562 RepID=UPI000682CD2F|nr:DUF2165 family protein [Aestuariivita boseongensis]
MFETVVLIAQTVSVAAIAAWLATGLYDNIRYPENNALYTAQVMSMERMQLEYPAEFSRVAHRAVTNRNLQRLAFRVVVLAELIATIMLIAGVVALLMALAGTGSVEMGRSLALIGAMLFTAVWAGFLIIGNYFCYWFCHEGGQNTHYQMTLWGTANMIFLAVA